MLFRNGARPRRIRGVTAVMLSSLVGLASGCAAWPDWRNGSPQHEHNSFCGHGYLQSTQPNPCPGDFAGADAWRGPLSQNEIRWHDPWRGDRPYPERPMPWSVPGNGNPADRTLPGRDTPHDTNLYPQRGAGEDPRGLPHWPLDEPARPGGE